MRLPCVATHYHFVVRVWKSPTKRHVGPVRPFLKRERETPREGKQTMDAAGKVLFQDTVQAFVFDVLGIETAHAESGETEKLDGVVQLLIEMRNKARADKDYATSDEIRDTLSSLGIQLKDGKEGTTYSL